MAVGQEWLKEDERRMLHVVYRVGNAKESCDYYEKHFGMHITRSRDVPEEKYSNAFLAYGDERTNFAVELTENHGVTEYDIGPGFGHFGIVTDDVFKTCESIKAAGGNVCRDPGPVKGGKTNIAFVEDPTGYKWELIEREKPTKEPLCQVMLRVSDLDASIKYYEEALGMTLLRKRENKEYCYTLAFMGYGPEEDNTVIELTYNWGQDAPYGKGNAYAQVALSTKDVYKTAEQIRAAGGTITREPGALPGIGTKIMATTDPDGWKYVMVDEADFLAEL